MDLIEDVAATRERLNQTIHTLRSKVTELAALNATEGERLALVERGAADLRIELNEVKRAEAERSARSVAPDDVSIERAYCQPARDLPVADLRSGGKLDVNRGVRHVGTGGGTVRMFGGLEGRTWQNGLLDDPAPKSDWQARAQEMANEIGWVQRFGRPVSRERLRSFRDHLAAGPAAVAKVFADNSGEGGDWIVTMPTALLQRKAETMRQLEALVPVMEMSDTTMTMPVLSRGVQPFLRSTPASGDLTAAQLPKSVPGTSSQTISAVSLTVNVPVDRDASEDSIVAAIPLMQLLVGEGLRDGTEDAMINGDTGTHGDTGIANWNPRGRWGILGAGNDHRYAWKGWRQRAFDIDATYTLAAQDFSASQTVSAYMGARAGLTAPLGTSMQSDGVGDLVYITSPEHYLAKVLIDTNLLTVDKYGAAATIVAGEVGRIGGKRLLLSDFVDVEYNTAGIYDHSTRTKTGMLIVPLGQYLMGRRRGVRIEVELVAREGTVYIVASERKVLHPLALSNVDVIWLYNLSV